MSIRSTLLAGPLGFGTAPLGNMYRNISDDEAMATVDAAWASGIRFFDTAPCYGAGHSPSSGLAERCIAIRATST
jgi:D-threo-aldose 1-dehydrogenase